MKSDSFCVPFEKLEPAAIAELHAVHPGALPISTEWRLNCGPLSAGSVVIWWCPSPEPAPPIDPAQKRRELAERLLAAADAHDRKESKLAAIERVLAEQEQR
jgi:hypothetical protein